MVHGFKNKDLMDITSQMRDTLLKFDKVSGLSLEIGNKREFKTDKLSFVATKYGHKQVLTDIVLNGTGMNYTIPLSGAKFPTEEHTLT
jgi:hypothetical protein